MPKKHCCERNQPERLWLAELEARMDRMEDVEDASIGLLKTVAKATIAGLRGDARLEKQLGTFWGRLMWMVRG